MVGGERKGSQGDSPGNRSCDLRDVSVRCLASKCQQREHGQRPNTKKHHAAQIGREHQIERHRANHGHCHGPAKKGVPSLASELARFP